MRLIDVDNFLKRFSYQVPGDTIDAIYLRLALLYEPKVEAIPVEWIRNEMEKAMEPNRYRDYDLIYCACVMQLLEHWRKENEI